MFHSLRCVLVLFLCFGWCVEHVAAQNLVPNPSFEDTVYCPAGANDMGALATWFNPTTASPDYFNACQASSGVPINDWGYQQAHDGNAYVSIVTYADEIGTADFREYVETELTDTLVGGQTYYWSMWVSLVDSGDYASNNIGLSLSSSLVTTTDNKVLSSMVYGNHASIIENETQWSLIKGEFIAQGNEKFVIVGNFYDDSQTDTSLVGLNGLAGHSAAYYIDDVCISTDSTTCNLVDGILDNETQTFSIYPNPVIGNAIRFNNFTDNLDYNLYNSIGQLVQNGKIEEEISIPELKGVYFIEVNSEPRLIKKIIINP